MTTGAPLTDATRVQLAATGDVGAFVSLYQTYLPVARRVAERRIGCPDQANDVAHDAFVWLLSGRWRLSPHDVQADGRIDKFVSTIVRYAALHARASRRSITEVSLDGPPTGDDTRTDWAWHPALMTQADPLPALIRRERRILFRAALAKLSPNDRAILRLRFVEQLTWPEVAARRGQSPNYMDRAYARIIDRLADHLGVPRPRLAQIRTRIHAHDNRKAHALTRRRLRKQRQKRVVA